MRPPVLCQLVMYPHARARARARIHTHAGFLLLLQVSVLSVSFMFPELLDWIRPSLVSVWYSALSVMAMTSHPYPMVRYIPTRGDSKTPEVYHTAQRRLRGHLRRSHIQAKPSVLCTVPRRGILWENIDYFILVIVGGGGSVRGRDVGDKKGGQCHRGLGSIHLTEDSHHTWFLVRPQEKFTGISISCISA